MKNFVALFISALGVVMFLASGLCGGLSGLLLSGWAFHGSEPLPLHWLALVLVAFMALFPAGTVGLLPAPWWLPPVVFSAPLLLVVIIAVSWHGQWQRILLAAVFIAAAFAGTRVFRPKMIRR